VYEGFVGNTVWPPDRHSENFKRAMLDDGSIEITFAHHNGDEAILKAIRQTSSTACQKMPPRSVAPHGRSPCRHRSASGRIGADVRQSFAAHPALLYR
jgi:hypothetical protein